ncbi:MAG: type II secretion system F family protein [bacterium]
MTRALVAGSVLLAFASAWQLAGARGEQIARAGRRLAARASTGRVRSPAEAAVALGIPARLARAGLEGRVAPPAVLAAKLGGTVVGITCAALALPAVPGRLDLVVGPVLAAAGFLGPDALLERAGRLRRGRLVAALPDVLDLLSVGAASGRSPTAVIREISRQGVGPLATELAVAVAEIDAGASQRDAVEALGRRLGGVEVKSLAAALERSRRYGSPLADQLREQASALRRDGRRRVEERASRAAPKIQLVVALVLVPSVLLMILAAIIAHSDALFGAV